MAEETGAWKRTRKIESPEPLLRMRMTHFSGCSLKETVLRAEEFGLGVIRSESLFKRLLASEGWLRWMAENLKSERWADCETRGYRLLAVDATCVSEPGSTGTDYRIHYAMDLNPCQCSHFELTDVKGGETLRRFPVKKKDLFIGDRAYGNAAGIAHIVNGGGDVLVRVNQKMLPLYDKNGQRILMLEQVKNLKEEESQEWTTWVKHPNGQWIKGRLIAFKMNPAHANRAQKRAQRRANRKQQKLSPEALHLAGYVLLWTSLGEEWSTEEICELYRARWQIELLFKRMKSIMGLGHLPKKNKQSAKAWICGKLLLALLVEKLIETGDATIQKTDSAKANRSRWREYIR